MNANQKKYRVIENYSIICADIPCVIFSFVIAYFIRLSKHNNVQDFVALRVLVVALLASIIYHAVANDGERFFSRGYLDEIIECIKRSVVLLVSIGFAVYAFRMEKGFSRLILAYFIVINFLMTLIARYVIKAVFLKAFTEGKKGDKVLIITCADRIEEVRKLMQTQKYWSFKYDSIAIMDEDRVGQEIDGVPVVASGATIMDAITTLVADVVFVYKPGLDAKTYNDIVVSIQNTGAMCHCTTELPAKNLFKVSHSSFAGCQVVTYSSIDYDYRMRLVKRVMDIIGALIGLIFTGILFPFVALAIKLDSPGPVIFKQTRLSKNGRQFDIYKFRTMYRDAEERKKELMALNEMQGNMFKMENDPRITKVGAFLRKTSIDELPQFLNVLMADMSLVGTRPPTVDEFKKYTDIQKRRLSIRPGLTGMWQVSGRSKISDFDEIVRLDLEYIDNWSLKLDFKILAKTIWVVFARKGAT